MPPNDWPEVALGDITRIEHGWPFKSEAVLDDDGSRPIVVGIGNFRYLGGFRFATTDVKTYGGPYPKEFELRPGDVLLVMTCQTEGGEILGIPGRIPDDGRIYLHNQRIGKVVVTRPDLADLDYLYWVFLWKDFNTELVASSSGTKIRHTAPSRIEAFKFKLPPLEQQRRIARLLGTTERRIEASRELNHTIHAIASAMFRSWFVNFEPVMTRSQGEDLTILPEAVLDLFPTAFVDSPEGPIPEGWTLESLDSIADFRNGLAMQRFPALQNPSLPVLKIAQLQDNDLTGSSQASQTLPGEYIVEDGDIIFSWSGTLLVKIWTGGRCALNQHLFKVTSRNFPKWFYYFWTLHHLPEFQATADDKKTTMGHIKRHHLHDAIVCVPSHDVMEMADRLLGPVLDHFVSNSVEARMLLDLQTAIIPQVLSGELQLTNNSMPAEATV